MSETFEPKIVAFVCNWCTYTGADLAGTSRTQYDANVRIIKLPCTGRISPLFIIKALEQGADGVLVSGCHPGDCHYTAGNYHARRKFTILLDLLQFMGIERERVQFSWVSAAEGKKWAEVVNEVTAAVRALGPRRKAWGEPDGKQMPKLQAQAPQAFSAPAGTFEAQEIALRAKARELLEQGAVQVVVGYGEGSIPGAIRPRFVTDPAQVDSLVWNEQCSLNLSTYLTRAEVQKLGKIGLVVKPCDERSVVGLLQENQIARDSVVLIGMGCHGLSEGGNLAEKCSRCEKRAPVFADHVIGEPSGETRDAGDDEIAQLEAMSSAERWNYWQAQFARCLRCYACRAACPMCNCDRCLADKTQPRWIPAEADARGNMTWHIVRALHQAGRCVGCNACVQACPAGVRLDLINRKLAQLVQEAFDYVPGSDLNATPPLTMYREDDNQDFIR